MSGLILTLPTIQNWSCHNCSGCCRQHAITITAEEKRRIDDQQWTEDDGIPAGNAVIEQLGPPWNRRYQLAHQADGACVFLREDGLCRIHAKFGEPAKPLACQVYPYAYHPAGKRVAVSLRYSCPSVVSNLGQPVSDQMRELKRMGREVVPAGVDQIPPPPVSVGSRVDWADFMKFVNSLGGFFEDPDVPIVVKLLRSLFWASLVEQSRFEKVQGARLSEFLEIITQATEAEVTEPSAVPRLPKRLSLTQFRMLVAQYARKDTQVDVSRGWRGRVRLFRAAWRFSRGTGMIPVLQPAFRPVPFAAIDGDFGTLPAEVEEIFSRYFRVKIQGLAFCGRAYFDISLVEGLHSLVLVFPAVMWLARWLAAGDGRHRIIADDVKQALAIADHQHGYTEVFGTSGFRRRVRILARLGDIAKLCEMYGR